MTRGVARIAGFHGTLTIAVGTLLLWLLVGPGVVVNLVTDQRSVFIQDYPPPTELVQRTGYRAIWGGRASAELAVQPGDAMLEVVIPASTPFASHYPEPLYQAAFMTRRSVAAVVVTLDLTVGGEFGTGTYVEGARARIDEIWFDRSESPLTVGSFIWIAAHSGTRVWRVGITEIVEHLSYARVPRAGGRYLLFLGVRGYRDTRSAQMNYGNAFEVRGRGLVSMTIPDGGGWRQSSDFNRVRTLVKRRAILPLPAPGEAESREQLLR